MESLVTRSRNEMNFTLIKNLIQVLLSDLIPVGNIETLN